MKDNEKRIAAYMLNLASNTFCNHTCCDVDDIAYEQWTIDDRKEFVRDYHIWSGNLEEYDEDYLHLDDWQIMDFMAYKLTIDNVKSSS